MKMKRGPAPKGTVLTLWSHNLAYAVGLITADGCMSKDGRHITFVSKDRELVVLFRGLLGLSTKIGVTHSGAGNVAFRTQFGDVLFYRFLLDIGLTPAKSNTISSVLVPDPYFNDFLRGYFDGDGTSFSYKDRVFLNSYRFYIAFTSGSEVYLRWLQERLDLLFGIHGHISWNKNNSYPQLRFSKKEAVILFQKMYYSEGLPCLKRKQQKARESMHAICVSRSGETGRRAVFRTQ